jgi:hypothetical protein
MNAPAIAQRRRATVSVLARDGCCRLGGHDRPVHHMAPMTDGLATAGTYHRVCRVRLSVPLMAIMIAVGVMDIPRQR